MAKNGVVLDTPSHRIPARNPANTGDSAKKKANSAELAFDWWWADDYQTINRKP